MESVAFFRYLKRFDDSFALKVLQESHYDFAGVHFCIIAGICDTAFLKYIRESQSRSKLTVRFNFHDSPHYMVFQHDIHCRILLSRHVKQRYVVTQKLFPVASDCKQWTFSVEVYYCRVLPVYCPFHKVRRKNGRTSYLLSRNRLA